MGLGAFESHTQTAKVISQHCENRCVQCTPPHNPRKGV